MAAAVAAPNLGAELKDGFKPVNAWVAGGIAWLEDIEQYYRERSAIEKEYAAKLNALAKKYHEKKGKKTATLSVGETPTLTPGSLENASLTTWTTQLQALEKQGSEHERLAVELISQVADPLKHFATKSEELRKNHVEYSAKLEKERDAAYTTLKRVKGKYDGACQELEGKRKKQDSSFDMNKSKAQQSYQSQLIETNNVKNTYLIAINVTNKCKEKHYHEYVPEVINSLQDLNETRVTYLNNIWLKATSLENSTHSRTTQLLQGLSTEIPRNEPYLDSGMFAQHNQPKWQEPADLGFEASPVWHDDAQFITDETAKVYLRNILTRSKVSRTELKRELDAKKRDVDKLRHERQQVRAGRGSNDEVQVVQVLFATQGELHDAERKWLTAETEVQTIVSVVGDISLGAQNHNFESTTFKIPTNCDLCGDRIWGLSAKGFDCRDCGYTCHSKCELKVPADCPGEVGKDERKKLKIERQEKASAALPINQPNYANGNANNPPPGVSEMPALSRSNTMNSLSSGYAASAARSVSDSAAAAPAASKPVVGGARKNRLVAPPPTAYVSHDAGGASELAADSMSSRAATSSEPRGKMNYAYTASGDGEVSLDEGQEFTILEADDGAGWMTVKTTSGQTGVVPASYVEHLPAALAAPPAIPMATRPRPQSSYSHASSTGSGVDTGPSASTASLASAITSKKKQGPAVAPKRGAKKLTYVTALYDYDARSEAEFSMREGEKFVLVNKDAGDGWADVERNGVKGSVPASYIE